jgi:hypothetical protein
MAAPRLLDAADVVSRLQATPVSPGADVHLAKEGTAQQGADGVSEEALKWLASMWHSYGMTRIRVSTTVDESLLQNARRLRSDLNDAALLDEALAALAAKHRATEIDAGYAAYDERPLDEMDEWGDLASFREVAASS